VLSCGQLLAAQPGAVVATVMAGSPERYPARLTRWDAAAGFRHTDDVVKARREEDRRALRVLDAQPLWMDFVDQQYRKGEVPYDPAEIGRALHEIIRVIRPELVLAPLGLGHLDHQLVQLAVRHAMRSSPNTTIWLYLEAMYRQETDSLKEAALSLRRKGVGLRPFSRQVPDDASRKQRAVAAYASQLKAFAELAPDLVSAPSGPEVYCSLTTAKPESPLPYVVG
jgi:LmbE family N-acetylglucosaminyl deacetylase